MLYDKIGLGYSVLRRPEPSWQAAINECLRECSTVVNVGAGTGSYEPDGKSVIAVEPSIAMLDQRPRTGAVNVRGVAEALPIADHSLDAAMTVLSLHHWTNWRQGLDEMRRVARQRVLVFTFDPAIHHRFWLIEDYLPEIADLPANHPPGPAEIAEVLADATVTVLPVPVECVDAVLPAFWARPYAYLDPTVWQCSSSLAMLPGGVRDAGLARLRSDLESGEWDQRHGDLASRGSLDCGFRLIATPSP